jgi:DNA adenine methylase
LRVIRSRDTPDAFFYLDPPYAGADQGHYGGYAREGFDALLGLPEGIQGKFPLSSYRNKALPEFIRRNGWHMVEFKMASPMTHGRGRAILTANYPVSVKPGQKGLRGAGKIGLRRLAVICFYRF